MKKLVLAGLIALSMTQVSKAQDYLFDNPDNEAYWGARLSFDIMALQSPSDIYGNRGGLEIGVIYNRPLWKNLYFEPGISMFYNSSSINGVYDFLGQELGITSTGTINNWGFRIPLNIGYHFDVTDLIQIAPFTGPMINLNFSNSTSYDIDANNPQNYWYPKLHYNIIDFGWNFGVGVKYQKYYIAVSGTVGLSRYIADNKNDYKNPTLDVSLPLYARRNLFQITLGYNF